VRVEGRLGVEHQLHLRGRADLTVGIRLHGHQVLHEIATVLRQVADRLTEPASDREQRELADVRPSRWEQWATGE
jgi:hypothetical protein